VRDFTLGDTDCKEIALNDVPFLIVPAEEIAKIDAIPEKYRPVFSVYPLTGPVRWYVHPELVRKFTRYDPLENHMVYLCGVCGRSKKKNPPTCSEFAIANGYDYGLSSRIRNVLEPLSLCETMVTILFLFF
jgi:hypothetical protein